MTANKSIFTYMKFKLLFVIFFSNFLYSQEKSKNSFTFSQFEITIPLKGNDTYGEIDENGNRSDYVLVPDGISSKFGYGIHHNKWLGISIHSGIDWKITPKLVAVPVYGQITINPKIGEETGIILQVGLGQSFALGRGNLSGTYHKIRLGLSDSDLSLFIDISLHGFQIRGNDMGSFSVGISLFTF